MSSLALRMVARLRRQSERFSCPGCCPARQPHALAVWALQAMLLGMSAVGLALLTALPSALIAAIMSAIEPRLRAYGDHSADQLRDLCALGQGQGMR